MENASFPAADSSLSVPAVPVQHVLDEATRSFVRRSLSAGLVEMDDLKKVVISLMSGEATFSPKRLAEGLVGAGVLTHWQASKLLAGKKKGFFLGSYRLLRPLGRGGMGVVYLGEHHVMKRLMALKILPPEAIKDERRIERFKSEARASAQLDHTNIVRAYDFSSAGKKTYIVMEYVDGIDLQHAVERDGVMSIADAIDVLTQATSGLAHAHERGIIHRDVKPSNLLLRTDGIIKVSDFGLARIGWTESGNGEARKFLGTADFVAPEQAIDSKTVDTRADIYSLGCSLYFMLTGQPPFCNGTAAQRLAKHQTVPIPDVRKFRDDCPESVAQLIGRMTAKRPGDRPKSAVELLSQVSRLGGNAIGGGRTYLTNIVPADDTVVDEAVYQATIDDSSLSSDGEVEIAVAGEFDFGSLPPVDLGALSTPVPGPAPCNPPVARKSLAHPKGENSPAAKSEVQSVLLGVGLAVALLALVGVIGIGIHSFSKPLPTDAPRVKSTEDGKVVIYR